MALAVEAKNIFGIIFGILEICYRPHLFFRQNTGLLIIYVSARSNWCCPIGSVKLTDPAAA